ncbi:MAG TPA: FKBP-type peptidyl-prolyl cis-trans isomerase [Allosphingosinicella sp.]|jgi:FKBP-type peptidyl-prolyl cis-trans isomerase FkpA|nr:FKBP-type peptidyl-prolyl cis-trans isomerase [Allosphingosinicella sp.]
MSVTAVPLRPIAKGSVAKLWIGLLVLALLAGAFAWWGTAAQQWTTTSSGLKYQVVKEGTGPTPTDADVVFVEYIGRLPDGTVFDSNVGKQPAPFPVKPGALIPGFTEGLHVMRKDGVYRLRIPAKLGYGDQAKPGIPANSRLDFDVHVIGILPEETVREMLMQQQLQQQMQGQGQGAGQATPIQ